MWARPARLRDCSVLQNYWCMQRMRERGQGEGAILDQAASLSICELSMLPD